MKKKYWWGMCAIGLGLLNLTARAEDRIDGSGPIQIAKTIETNLPETVQFELGRTEFEPGDKLTIERVRGTSEKIKEGGVYSAEGTYVLTSRDEADLAFFTTSFGPSGSTPIEPSQIVHIKKGKGTFRLVQTIPFDGYPHVSFYDGNSFGGVYFGQGDRVMKESSHAGQPTGPNAALFKYLGKPVYEPKDLDARYSKNGLMKAIKLAAKRADITVKTIQIDDSEFPFLVGIICGGADAGKLKAEIKKMDDYSYGGSVGNDVNADSSDTCNTFNLTPAKMYPPGTSEAIAHRLLLRQQVFFDRLNEGK